MNLKQYIRSENTKTLKPNGELLILILLIITLIVVILCHCSFNNNVALAAEQRTLVLTWDKYVAPSGIGIRIFKSLTPGIYNFGKEYAVADVPADINEATICVDLNAYNFVAVAYRLLDPNNVSEPSNEFLAPPGAPNIKKKNLFGGCGL